jgi:hypothetical protein
VGFRNLTQLLSLELRNNQLGGRIPDLSPLKSLRNLELEGNMLADSIPTTLGDLPSLFTLTLNDNQLFGSIPSELGKLRNLIVLTLSNNKLTGSIPTSLGNLVNLQFLSISNTEVGGVVPESFRNLTELRQLYLSRNQLNGSVPEIFNNFNYLLALRLDSNRFTGMPSSLATLANAKTVVFPNPVTNYSFSLLTRNPSFLLSDEWIPYLGTPLSTLGKRQLSSSVSNFTAEQLYAMCPLNDIRNPEVPAGCIAGIYKSFCVDINTEAKLSRCHSIYDQVFAFSIFKSIGEVCPAWKKGPRSFDCLAAIKNFKYELPYMTVTPDHAANLTASILGSQMYAPCYNTGRISCRW